MGFRFYRSLRIFPCIRANISKSGLSATVGVRGANMNIGPKSKRYTLGLPITGLSYVKSNRYSNQSHGSGSRIVRYLILAVSLAVAVATIAAIIAL